VATFADGQGVVGRKRGAIGGWRRALVPSRTSRQRRTQLVVQGSTTRAPKTSGCRSITSALVDHTAVRSSWAHCYRYRFVPPRRGSEPATQGTAGRGLGDAGAPLGPCSPIRGTVLLGTVLLASAVSMAIRFVSCPVFLGRYIYRSRFRSLGLLARLGTEVGRYCFSDYEWRSDIGMRPNPWEPYPLFLPPDYRPFQNPTRRPRWCAHGKLSSLSAETKWEIFLQATTGRSAGSRRRLWSWRSHGETSVAVCKVRFAQ
jgi:hypothetical protein